MGKSDGRDDGSGEKNKNDGDISTSVKDDEQWELSDSSGVDELYDNFLLLQQKVNARIAKKVSAGTEGCTAVDMATASCNVEATQELITSTDEAGPSGNELSVNMVNTLGDHECPPSTSSNPQPCLICQELEKNQETMRLLLKIATFEKLSKVNVLKEGESKKVTKKKKRHKK